MTDQEYLDRCAIEAMNSLIAVKFVINRPQSPAVTANVSYIHAEAMLAERKKRMEGENK